MVKDNNAAGRLHKILVAAKSKQPDYSMKKIWAEVFGLEDTDLPGIYTNLVRLQESLATVERDIKLQDVDPEVYLQHFPSIRQLLALPNLETRLDRCTAMLSEGILTTLQFCSERLSKNCPENVPAAESISELSSELTQLFDRIQSSSLPKGLKIVLLELLEAMRQSLAEFQIRGGSGLRQELFYILERLQRTIPLLEQSKESVEVVDFWNVLMKYDTLSSVCVNAPAVISGFRQALTAIGMG